MFNNCQIPYHNQCKNQHTVWVTQMGTKKSILYTRIIEEIIILPICWNISKSIYDTASGSILAAKQVLERRQLHTIWSKQFLVPCSYFAIPNFHKSWIYLISYFTAIKTTLIYSNPPTGHGIRILQMPQLFFVQHVQ